MLLNQRGTIAAEEAEKHVHNREIWFGDAASPSAGTHEADVDSLTAFRVDSGNTVWGTAIQVLGSSDTPVVAGMAKYDCHKVLILDAERTGLHYLRFTFGASEAAGITAGTYTVVALNLTASIRTAAVNFLMRRANSTDKLWVNCKTGADTGWVDFVFGLHEYKY